MTMQPLADTTPQNIWAQARHWLKDFDQAVHYDPHEGLRLKIARLEARLQRLEAAAAGPTTPYSSEENNNGEL